MSKFFLLDVGKKGTREVNSLFVAETPFVTPQYSFPSAAPNSSRQGTEPRNQSITKLETVQNSICFRTEQNDGAVEAIIVVVAHYRCSFVNVHFTGSRLCTESERHGRSKFFIFYLSVVCTSSSETWLGSVISGSYQACLTPEFGVRIRIIKMRRLRTR